jgi:hypothetical protein
MNVGEQFGRGEVAVPRADEVRHRTPRTRYPIARASNCRNNPLHTGVMILSLINLPTSRVDE